MLAYEHSHLANKIIGALPKEMSRDQVVINMLVRMTTTGWVELLIFVGNGAGLGAMKIARGMFETAVMAEYLRRTPEEIEDYIEYGHVLDFKRIKLFPDAVSAEKAREIENEYGRVKPSGHVYLLQALETLNAYFDLGFDLNAVGEEFERVWRKSATSAASGD